MKFLYCTVLQILRQKRIAGNLDEFVRPFLCGTYSTVKDMGLSDLFESQDDIARFFPPGILQYVHS
jgi:hypothetical protein